MKSKVVYVLYEAMLYDENGNNRIITITELAKKYGLRRSVCKSVSLGNPQDEPINTNKVAYVHLYPQANEENYIKIKKELINVRN